MVVSLYFTNHCSFKIGAVVSGQHYFGHCPRRVDKNTDIVSTFDVTESTWREEAKKLAWNLQDIPNDKLALLTL